MGHGLPLPRHFDGKIAVRITLRIPVTSCGIDLGEPPWFQVLAVARRLLCFGVVGRAIHRRGQCSRRIGPVLPLPHGSKGDLG
jgi:hypothetical protein